MQSRRNRLWPGWRVAAGSWLAKYQWQPVESRKRGGWRLISLQSMAVKIFNICKYRNESISISWHHAKQAISCVWLASLSCAMLWPGLSFLVCSSILAVAVASWLSFQPLAISLSWLAASASWLWRGCNKLPVISALFWLQWPLISPVAPLPLAVAGWLAELALL